MIDSRVDLIGLGIAMAISMPMLGGDWKPGVFIAGYAVVLIVVRERHHIERIGPPMDIIDTLKADCNRYSNGHCSTSRCVRRGMDATGAKFPLADYSVSTCEQHEAVLEIEKLRDLVRTLVENDPQEPISDAGHVVLDLWRHDARKVLGLPEPQQAMPAFEI